MDKTVVSVICIVYNHAKYIEKCIESILNQKTNFKYELLIHDDASIDGTQEILKNYQTQYPNIIKVIYEKENQYSKGLKIAKTFLYPIAQGKYFAFCEGDDCWIDDNKLQMQYDFMESHKNYFLCTHACYVNNCENPKHSYNKHTSNYSRDFSLEECFKGGGGLFATSSYFLKREVAIDMPKCFECKWMGDYQLVVYAAIKGKVYYIDKVMSQYNYMSINSWSKKVYTNNTKMKQLNDDIISMLKKVDLFYENQYSDIINECIEKYIISTLLIDGNYKYVKKNYKKYYQTLTCLQKMKFNLKCLFEKQLKKKYNSN